MYGWDRSNEIERVFRKVSHCQVLRTGISWWRRDRNQAPSRTPILTGPVTSEPTHTNIIHSSSNPGPLLLMYLGEVRSAVRECVRFTCGSWRWVGVREWNRRDGCNFYDEWTLDSDDDRGSGGGGYKAAQWELTNVKLVVTVYSNWNRVQIKT